MATEDSFDEMNNKRDNMKKYFKDYFKGVELSKKLVVGFLLISLLNYLACTTMNIVTKESKIEEMESGKFTGEIYLITVDNFRYHFEEWSYNVKNDTLFGNGFEVSTVGEIPFRGAIPTEKINYFEFKKADALATIGLVVGIAAATMVFLGTIWLISLNNSLDSQ